MVLEDVTNVEGKDIRMSKKVLPTNFLLAVQETNFLYSFTQSGFVALATTCTMIIKGNFQDEKNGQLSIMMVITSGIYCVYGVCISVMLYGRKTDHLMEIYE